MRVGLLGGSFDPVHHGHLIVADALAETLSLDEVRLVPAREQPFKAGRHEAPAEDRAAMVGAAIAGHPRLRLERAELDRPGPSFTVETLRILHAREPGVAWVLLLGVDAARDFPAWKDPEGIEALAEVVVFRREGVSTAAPAGRACVDAPGMAISATGIRARVRAGRSIRYWVPDAVAAYVADHGLYRDGTA